MAVRLAAYARSGQGRRVLAVIVAMLAAGPAQAQQPFDPSTGSGPPRAGSKEDPLTLGRDLPPTQEPLPWFVADLHGALAGLPGGDGWVPPVSALTPRPGRGLGVGAAAHVHVLRIGPATIGIGVSALAARKAGAPRRAASTGTPTTPAVSTSMTSVHPQVSLNFGHRYGWSYLSGGVGRTKVASTASAFGALGPASAPVRWNPAINYGGGARWFMKPHLAASFDVRITQLGSRQPTSEYPYFALRTRLVHFLAGVSIQ